MESARRRKHPHGTPWPGPCLLLAMIALTPAGASAEAAVQPLEEIRDAARRHLEARPPPARGRLEIEVGALDPRLRLARCGEALETADPPGGARLGKTTVAVRCTGPKPWSLYVPATARLYGEVVVLARNLPRGTLLEADQLRLEERDLGRLRQGYFSRIEAPLGMRLTRNATAGRALLPSQVATRTVVRRGDEIMLIGGGGAIDVRMKGKALDSGAIGERIRVLNLRSGRELEGEIVSTGEVRVGY